MSAQTDALAQGLFDLAEAVRASANDPADAIRLLSQLATYSVPVPAATSIWGQEVAGVTSATAALCRRAALISLARAVADYQPLSYDDAVAVRDQVAGLLDTEITYAADTGDTQSYLALRDLRTNIVQDLTTRGAQLPRLMTVTRNRPLPALVLAYELYADATRTDELISRVNPPHPAYFPTTFEALSA
jgi:prophage DNA circulation protein